MSDAHAVARDQLRAFIQRIERLEEEKKTISDDIKDVYGEAKGVGFDTVILRKVISIRKQDRDQRAEQEAILETYLIALGMLPEPFQEDDQEPTRPAIQAVPGGEPSIPSSDAGGAKMDGSSRPGRPDEQSGHIDAKSERATIPNSPVTATEQPEAHGSSPCIVAREANRPATYGQLVTAGETAPHPENVAAASNGEAVKSTEPQRVSLPVDEVSSEGSDAGGENVESSAPRAGQVPTSNTGEGAASALPAKSRLRPHCLNPGEKCGGYGDKHCHDCLRAMRESEAA